MKMIRCPKRIVRLLQVQFRDPSVRMVSQDFLVLPTNKSILFQVAIINININVYLKEYGRTCRYSFRWPGEEEIFLKIWVRKSAQLHWNPSSFAKIACKTCINSVQNDITTKRRKTQQKHAGMLWLYAICMLFRCTVVWTVTPIVCSLHAKFFRPCCVQT